jgi:hypothetical protein
MFIFIEIVSKLTEEQGITKSFLYKHEILNKFTLMIELIQVLLITLIQT